MAEFTGVLHQEEAAPLDGNLSNAKQASSACKRADL
jgi:hypothetical protein